MSARGWGKDRRKCTHPIAGMKDQRAISRLWIYGGWRGMPRIEIMSQQAPRETWSELDDAILAAWMRMYEKPLAPSLTFQIVNGLGDAVLISSLDVESGAGRRAWWQGWTCSPPVTIRVRDANGDGFDFQLPLPDRR